MTSQNSKLGVPDQALSVAICQMTSIDNVDANLQQVKELLEQIPAGTDLACFPENSLYFRLSKTEKIPALNMSDAVFSVIQKIVDHKNLSVLLGSAPMLLPNGRTGNSTVFFKPGQRPEVVYRKIHLFDVDVAGAPPVRESDSFEHGSEPKILEINGWRLGLTICYDLRFSELYSQYSKAGVHAILVPSAFLVPTGKAHWHILLRARAIESQVYVLAAAQAGRHESAGGSSRNTFGHSLAVDPWGEVLADLGESGRQLSVVNLDPSRLEWVHSQIPQSTHRRLPR